MGLEGALASFSPYVAWGFSPMRTWVCRDSNFSMIVMYSTTGSKPMSENECRGKPCVCPRTETGNDPMSETNIYAEQRQSPVLKYSGKDAIGNQG